MADPLFTLAELGAWTQTAVPADTADLALKLTTSAIRAHVGADRYDTLTDVSGLKLTALGLAGRMVTNPAGLRSTSRQIDDYTETDTWATETLTPATLTDADRATIDEALGVTSGSAFTVRPHGEPDRPDWRCR